MQERKKHFGTVDVPSYFIFSTDTCQLFYNELSINDNFPISIGLEHKCSSAGGVCLSTEFTSVDLAQSESSGLGSLTFQSGLRKKVLLLNPKAIFTVNK